MRKLALAVLLLLAPLVHAATFSVADDATLVRASKAIVRGRAGKSFARWAPGGWIETVTTIAVDERVKGDVGDSFDVVELGGVVDGVGYAVAGAARFSEGERVLLFLDTNARGEWVPRTMTVGKFSQQSDLLVRDDISGWDLDGTPHREPLRDAEKFVTYVRRVANGESPLVDYLLARPSRAIVANATPAASTYLLQDDGGAGHLGIRWPDFPAAKVFVSHGTQPGALNGGLTSLQRAFAAWTDGANSNIVYQYGGTTNVASSGFKSGHPDNINTVQFNDPADEIPGAYSGTNGDVLAIGGAWYDASSIESTHSYNGERFYTILEADLVVQNGINGAGIAGNGFDHVVTHELGHTLGLRHSDEPPAGGTRATAAIMNSSVAFSADAFGSNLQSWDREAIAAVYGSAGSPVTCNAPAIVTQPQAASIQKGSAAVLSVVASGDAPLQYQWYSGTKGNTSQPLTNATSSSISIAPTLTMSFWVRVSNACAPPADSNSVTVTVNGCAAVSIDTQPPSVTIIEGRSATLTLAASTSANALSIQWYRGVSGNTSAPIANETSASITVQPSATSSYWARVTSICGAIADTDTIIVTVQPCNAPAIVVAPSGGNALISTTATLYLAASGTAPLTIRWYEGARGDTSRPAINGDGPTLVTPALITATSYWARVTNPCGAIDSDAVMVNIVTSCNTPSILTQPLNAMVASGAQAKLSVVASGASLTYQWYAGPLFDFTSPVGGSAPSFVSDAITQPSQFWVRVGSACGSVNSVAATITPAASSRRRPTGH